MEPEAWQRVYEAEVPTVYRALVATLRDPALAEDALHAAFEAGLRHPPRTSENLAGWLYRVAVRHGTRRRLNFRPLRAATHAPEVDEIDQLLDRLEAGRLLALLTVRQRALVVARYYLGLSQRETAALFGIRPGTVSATIAQALLRMRKEMLNV
jgi:RNA polymerase sigma factor (sigma-70 family)